MTDIDLSPARATDLFLASLRPDTRLLVAISGGSDSTGLLLALADAIANPSHTHVRLTAATIDHGLRAESAAEARAVAALCARYSIPHVTLHWDAEKPNSGISAAAREARYHLLAQAAGHFQADAIVTAHTLDDQMETVAMRAARNEDEQALGLAGMAEATLLNRSIWIMRPFLCCRRQAIRQDILQRGEGWIDDPSNLDPHYERVRTRLSMVDNAPLPPTFPAAAARRNTLSHRAAALLDTYGNIHEQALLHLDLKALAEDPETLRYALGALLAALGGNTHRPGKSVMDKVMTFVEGNHGRMTAARCLLQLRRDGLYILRENRAILPLQLAAGQSGLWDGRFRIVNGTAHTIVIDADREASLNAPANGVPQALLRQAARLKPRISPQSQEIDRLQASLPQVEISVALPHFDRFLPEHDLAFANSVARLMGRPAFPGPPRRSC